MPLAFGGGMRGDGLAFGASVDRSAGVKFLWCLTTGRPLLPFSPKTAGSVDAEQLSLFSFSIPLSADYNQRNNNNNNNNQKKATKNYQI